MSTEDIKRLELLSMFHYILGGLMALAACAPIMNVLLGIGIAFGKYSEFFVDSSGSGPPPAVGWAIAIIGVVFIVLGWCLAACIIVAGKKLKRHRSRGFCMIVAVIECMFIPFGTILGVLTIIALNQDSTKKIFD